MGHHNMFHQPPLPQPDEWTQVGTANISAPSGVMMRASTSTSLLRVASSPRPGPALMEPRSPTTAPSPPTNTPAKAADTQTSAQLSTNYKEAHGHFPRDLPLLRPQLGGPPYLYSPSRISMRNSNIGSQLAASQSMPVLLSTTTPETRNGALIDQQGLQPHAAAARSDRIDAADARNRRHHHQHPPLSLPAPAHRIMSYSRCRRAGVQSTRRGRRERTFMALSRIRGRRRRIYTSVVRCRGMRRRDGQGRPSRMCRRRSLPSRSGT